MPSASIRRALLAAVSIGLAACAAIAAPHRAVAAEPLPACRFDDRPAPAAGYDDWASTLVDTIYRLPSGYEPPDLVFVGRAGLDGDGYVRSFVIADLSDMLQAAARDGIRLRSVSAYRSEQTQAHLLAEAEASSGTDAALALTARPGHSEHELGTTLDLGPGDGSAPWDGDWGQSPEGSWLGANSWRYGFVLSYPAAMSPATTCYQYEPWHFRYFGRERAAEIHASGLAPREFLWRLLSRAAEPTNGQQVGGATGGEGGGQGGVPGRNPVRSDAPDDVAAGSGRPTLVAPFEGVAIASIVAGGAFALALRRRRRRKVGARSQAYRPRS